MLQLATKLLLAHSTCMTVPKSLGDAHPSTRVHLPWNSRRLGRDLDKISIGLHTKFLIHVREGLKRPEAPMQAVEFASEGGIIFHGHIPILTRWMDYKAQNEKYLKDYIGKLAMDNLTLIPSGRYWLKKMYFNGLAANEVPIKTPVTTMNDD
uniref:Uncharacterized protein n=1 Tax=Setaria italica TaxID=4555 RepID=K3Y2Q4_SETIT